MKVEGPGRLQPSGPIKPRNKAAKRDGPSFADSIGNPEEPSTAAVTGSSPLSSIDALLPLQEVSDNQVTSGALSSAARKSSIASMTFDSASF